MINLFAATGHIHYAKSGRLFLQEMLRLKPDYPWVYTCFTNHGLLTIRRSDRFWAGLLKDLIIEQVMMRSLKSRGGLTRGALPGVSMGHHKLNMSQSYRVGVESRKLCPCSVKTDIAAAPEFVFNVIPCSCKTTSKNMCGTKLCSCKNGLACVAAGSDCRGTSCNNVSEHKSIVILDDDILDHI